MRRAGLAMLALAAFVAWRAYQDSNKTTGALDALEVAGNLLGARMMGTQASKMDISEKGLAMIAAREGFSAKRYKDADGYSIGYGHFIKQGEAFTEPMSEATAREILRRDAQVAADAVRAYVKTEISQNQFDALASFAFNVGAGALKRSTLLAKLNGGDATGAAQQFAAWNKSGGVVLAALITRRASEAQQFTA